MARVFLTTGQTYGYIGPFEPATDVIGTNGNERVFVQVHGKARFDPSFNRGGDEIIIEGNSSDYLGARVGSNIVMTSPQGAFISIPAGNAGTKVTFDNGSFTLIVANGGIRLGAQVMTDTPDKLDDLGTPAAPAASAALSFTAEADPAEKTDAPAHETASLSHLFIDAGLFHLPHDYQAISNLALFG